MMIYFHRFFKGILLFLFIQLFYTISDTVATNGLTNNIQDRSFVVDYRNDAYLKDGEPFVVISGSFHYFRSVEGSWRRKLRTMRAAGLNTVETYIEWATHNPQDGVYNWDGMGNLEKFIKLADSEGLLVILRPGPYICAERDMGGFPSWLLHKYPSIKLRTSDQDYLNEVATWYSVLFPKIVPHLYNNGGNIIQIGIENEYGSFSACDGKYLLWLKNLTESYVGNNVVLITNDGPADHMLTCGRINGAVVTADVSDANILNKLAILRKYMPHGPLQNTEFYPGWLTHWGERLQQVHTSTILPQLSDMLKANVSVNFYMFYGGTNFGFTAGANTAQGNNGFLPDITSYDYDAPMSENGDPTPKYMAIRDTIRKYAPLPDVVVPPMEKTMAIGPISLNSKGCVIRQLGKTYLTDYKVENEQPMSFEQLNQAFGFLLYETFLPELSGKTTAELKIAKIHDRAQVYQQQSYVGNLSREFKINSLWLKTAGGHFLQLFVENQGRINFKIANDFKGILSSALYDNQPLKHFTMYGYSFDNYTKIKEYIKAYDEEVNQPIIPLNKLIQSGPILFYTTFELNIDEVYDTYLDTTGWTKGFVFINGFNIGRYWPVRGPQVTLYVPREILKQGVNEVVLIELDQVPQSVSISFVHRPDLGV